MGYGGRGMQLLEQYYEGKFPCLKEDDDGKKNKRSIKVSDVRFNMLRREEILFKHVYNRYICILFRMWRHLNY